MTKAFNRPTCSRCGYAVYPFRPYLAPHRCPDATPAYDGYDGMRANTAKLMLAAQERKQAERTGGGRFSQAARKGIGA